MSEERGTQPPPETAPEGPLGSVLVVEDDPANTELMLDIVGGLGWDVDHAADGVQALSMTAQKDYDLVLLDLHMPNLDGADVMRVMNVRPNKPARIAIVTADVLYGAGIDLSELGAYAIIGKPIDIPALEAVLAEVAESRRSGKVA